MPPVSHLIKVLNGPHTGAQSGLGEGDELLVGNSTEADIILADPHILAHHCRITILDGNASVTPADGEVLVDGSPVSGTFRLGPERVVTIGSTSLVIGPREGPWPAVTIPSQREVSSRRGKDAKDRGDGVSSTAPFRILLPALLILSLGIFIASVITATGSRKQTKTVYPGTEDAEREKSTEELSGKSLATLAENLRKEMPGLTVLKKETPPHGELVVFAPDEETALRIRKDVATKRMAVVVQVINLEEVNKALADILRGGGQGIDVMIQPDGSLLWKGYLPNRKDLESIRAKVRQDLPFLGTDRDQIMYGEVVMPEINSLLASSALSSGIVAKPDKDHLVLEGSFPPEKAEQWKEFRKQIATRFPGLKIEEKVNSAHGGHEIEHILGGHIAGITFGKSAWIELADGSRLFPGTRLANGMTLLSLSEREVTFQTAEGILRVPLTGMMP